MWLWKRINSNYIHVTDENGWNKARFIRKTRNDPWKKVTIDGEVPFTTASPEFKEMLPRSIMGKPRKNQEPLDVVFGIRVEASLASQLQDIPNDEIRALLREWVEKRKKTQDQVA